MHLKYGSRRSIVFVIFSSTTIIIFGYLLGTSSLQFCVLLSRLIFLGTPHDRNVWLTNLQDYPENPVSLYIRSYYLHVDLKKKIIKKSLKKTTAFQRNRRGFNYSRQIIRQSVVEPATVKK